ncbi:MAG: tetraether lipid synthase Tes [Candidatus Hydrothermarchaeota archaeon]
MNGFETKSLCPVCFKHITAKVYEENEKILIEKKCSEHGEFRDTYWGNSALFYKAMKFKHEGDGIENPHKSSSKGCPYDCGLCPSHKSPTVLGLIDVTNRCNLRCPVCFADSNSNDYIYEPSFEQIRQMLKNLRRNRPIPTPAIQYSGGEPTVRDDIIDLVRLAKDLGFVHVQLASNGIRLANSPMFAKKLRDAGLNTLYLQFDGVTEKPYLSMRGQNILPLKLKAIENCRRAGLGVVLVPTLVKGINDKQVGDIIRFAAENADVIRGVNVQPVSFTGRIDQNHLKENRITIPDFINEVELQTEGQIKKEDWYPVPSVVPISHFVEHLSGSKQVEFTAHPHCGMATYIFLEKDRLIPITRFIDVEGMLSYLDSISKEIKGNMLKKAKYLIKAKELMKFIDKNSAPKGIPIKRLLLEILTNHSYNALGDFHARMLLLGVMHFQDLYNIDIERLRRCVIHYAVPDGRIIPFCAMNTLYRSKIEKEFSKKRLKVRAR